MTVAGADNTRYRRRLSFSLLRRTLVNHLSLFAAGILAPGTLLRSRMARATGLPDDPLDRLQRAIQGKVVHRASAHFELARQSLVWQMKKPSRTPEAIVHVATIPDIVAILNFSRATGRRVAIRCGGHGYDASFLEEDTLLLDISMLRDVTVDQEAMEAWAGPGVRAMDFVRILGEQGLSFPAAHCGNVPLGGFLLGGGLGWNGEAWGGMSCFNITAVQVVTAAGELVTADETRNADLYWAARGGGPNFPGVITRFRLGLYRNPTAILTSTYVWPLDAATTVAAQVAIQAAIMPVNTEILLILADDGKGAKVLFVQATAFVHTEAEGRLALQPLAGMSVAGNCLDRDEFKPTTLGDLYQWDATAYPQWRWAVDCLWTDASPETFMDRLVEQARAMPSDRSSILLLLKPHTSSLPDAAFSMIGTTYVASYAIWGEPNQDTANRAWVDGVSTVMKPETKGHYINESAYVDHPERNPGSYAASNWKKLRAIKRAWDPGNVIHTYADRGA